MTEEPLHYTTPTLTDVGSLRDLTESTGPNGPDDGVYFTDTDITPPIS